MYVEEYGKENRSVIVMLHGANFVHCFGRQYSLAEKYHIVVPHIMGFGNETDRVFDIVPRHVETVVLIDHSISGR